MAKIIIFGAGAMGSAFSVPCADNNHETIIVGSHLDDKFIDQINKKNNFHPLLNINISNKVKFIKEKNLLDQKNASVDLIVIGTNSKGLEWCAEKLNKIYKSKKLPPLLLLTKGLSVYRNKFETLEKKLLRLLFAKGYKNINISAIAGPCLASDLGAKAHSSIIVANKNLKTANWLKKLLENDYYHIYSSNDINGVEIAAAIKNIFSIVIGSAQKIPSSKNIKQKNLKYLNTSAALFNQCIFEMELFVSALRGKKNTVKGLAGIGDLYVSAAGGRNSLLGNYLGQGFVYSEIKKNQMKNITVEGADLSFEIYKLVKKQFKLEQLPLMFSVMEAIVNNKKIKINWNNFS